MNKVLFFILLLFSINTIKGNNINDLLIGSWIKTDIEFVDGSKLPIENSVNMQYLRFTFRDSKTLYKSTSFDFLGGKFEYSILNDRGIKAEFILYEVEKVTKDSLILKEITQTGKTGFRYFFEKESLYQSKIRLDSSMFYVVNSDTIYLESEKFRPEYLGDLPFQFVLSQKLSNYRQFDKEELFMVSMIINEYGELENITLQKGINEKYDNKAIEIIKQNAKKWKPATYNGKTIKTLKILKIQYGDPQKMPLYHLDYFEGIKFEQIRKFDKAIKFFTKCIELNPDDPDAYYHRGICKIKQEKFVDACSDFSFVKNTKKYDIESLIKKYCEK